MNRTIESLHEEDIFVEHRNITLHLFSNILDVPRFDIHTLCETIQKNIGSANWKYIFICVSPYIDDLRNQRIESFYQWWSDNYTTVLISSRQGNMGKWTRYEKVFSAAA